MYSKVIRLGIIICLLLSLLFSFSYIVNAVGVRPMKLNLEMKRGETQKFQLELSPEEKQSTVELSLYDLRQQKTGELNYEKGDLDENTVLNWLELPEQVVVPPGEEKTVDIEVSVPYDAKGTHTAIIMVEPKVKKAAQGITIQVRYAVRVNIHIDTPGLRRRAEVTKFKLTSDNQEQPLLQTHIKNPSLLSYKAAGEVTIRGENRQLIERVPIRSQYAAQAGRDETTIYPGSEVIFKGAVTEPLTAGTYDLQLYLYYADGRQLIKRKTVEVGDEFIDPDNLKYIEVDPTHISETLRKGGAHTAPIDIRNRMGDPVQVKIGTQKIKSDYEHSLLDNFKLQIRGGQEFKLEGRRSKRPVLIARAPREDIKEGGYYDKLQINVTDPKSGEKLQTETVNLEMIIGEEFNYSGKIQDLTTKTMENEVLLSATVLNTSNIHFKPKAKIYLIQDEEIKHTIFLEMPEENQRILPEKTGVLSNYAQDIEPGKYKAEVTLQYQEEEIGKEEFEVEIKSGEQESENTEEE